MVGTMRKYWTFLDAVLVMRCVFCSFLCISGLLFFTLLKNLFVFQLIFVKEYTVAEGQAFHVKHFCCYECDDPLGGKQYVPKDGQPICLPCYGQKYGKVGSDTM